MKKRSFLAGMLTMALIVGLGFSALAATGQVSFNASALSLNGTQVSAKGENYTLANGQSVPASITYTDEKGGGTTYLPVRRISELLGVETGWDGASGSVTVSSAALPSQPPVTTTPPTDYSDWSKEDEAAYQEFKGLWERNDNLGIYSCTSESALSDFLQKKTEAQIIAHTSRFAVEVCKENSMTSGLVVINYAVNDRDSILWSDTCINGEVRVSGYRKDDVLKQLTK